MYSKRIYTTLEIKMAVLTEGESISLLGRDITVILVDPRGNKTFIEDFSIGGEDENEITFIYEGKDQKYTGRYRVDVFENYMKEMMSALDSDVFDIVPRTKQEKKGEGFAKAVIDLSLDKN